MSFLDKLFTFFRGEEKMDENTLVEAHVCPNCWGKQEYAGEIKEYAQIRDSLGQKAFVAKFVETHLDGIKLEKNGDALVCKKCNAKVVKTEAHKD